MKWLRTFHFGSFKDSLSPNFRWPAFFILPLLPLLSFLFYFMQNTEKLNKLEIQMEQLHRKAINFKKQKDKEALFLTQIQKTEPNFIEKHLSTLVLLEPEMKKLHSLSLDTLDTQVKKKLSWIEKGGNHLIFIQQKLRFFENLQESEEIQQEYVEMNEEDLKRVLSLIEGIPIGHYVPPLGRPPLLIKDFHLSRTKLYAQENAFLIKIDLIKREGIKNNKDNSL